MAHHNPASLDAAARRIGDRWSLRVLGALQDDGHTFGELAEAVEGIAPTILTSRLRALQRMGLVTASAYQRRPPRMRYSLTASGRHLGAAITSLADWGASREGHDPARVHDTCGSSLQLRPWCPTCERVVEPEGDAALTWC